MVEQLPRGDAQTVRASEVKLQNRIVNILPLMIEQKLLGVDQCADDVFVTLLFLQFEIGLSILALRFFSKVIQSQFQFLRLGFAGVNRVVKFANFDRVLPLRILREQRRAATDKRRQFFESGVFRFRCVAGRLPFARFTQIECAAPSRNNWQPARRPGCEFRQRLTTKVRCEVQNGQTEAARRKMKSDGPKAAAASERARSGLLGCGAEKANPFRADGALKNPRPVGVRNRERRYVSPVPQIRRSFQRIALLARAGDFDFKFGLPAPGDVQGCFLDDNERLVNGHILEFLDNSRRPLDPQQVNVRGAAKADGNVEAVLAQPAIAA